MAQIRCCSTVSTPSTAWEMVEVMVSHTVMTVVAMAFQASLQRPWSTLATKSASPPQDGQQAG